MKEPIKWPEPQPVESLQPHQQGHKVWPVAEGVDPNEPALLLYEHNEQAPDYSGFRRYQTIYVIRGDVLAKYMEDMGPAILYPAVPLQIPGDDPTHDPGPTSDWETVGSLQGNADELRDWLLSREIKHEIPNFEALFHDDVAQENLWRKHQSQFGSMHKVVRNEVNS